MRHLYFGQVALSESRQKLRIIHPSVNPFDSKLSLDDSSWIFYGEVREVLGLIASINQFHSKCSSNITAVVTRQRYIDGVEMHGVSHLMSVLVPCEETICANAGIPKSLLDIGRARFSEWCSVTFMGHHPMMNTHYKGIAVHWLQSRLKGPSAGGAIAQYFRELTPTTLTDHAPETKIYRAIGGHLLPNHA